MTTKSVQPTWTELETVRELGAEYMESVRSDGKWAVRMYYDENESPYFVRMINGQVFGDFRHMRDVEHAQQLCDMDEDVSEFLDKAVRHG